LRGNFTKVQALFGTNGCSDNIRKLFCGWTCGNNQYDFIDYNRGFLNISAKLDVAVDMGFANQLFNSCSSHCFDDRTGNPQVVSTKFAVGRPASLIGFFNSASDPGFRPNTDTLPVVTYTVSPTTGFTTTASAASGADLTGCAAAPTSTTTGSSDAGVIYPIMTLVLLACSVLSVMF